MQCSDSAHTCPRCGALLQTDIDDASRTILRPVKRDTGKPCVVFADGQRVPLQGRLLVGRNPRQEDGATSISVDDPDYSVSKTHVQVLLDGDAVWVTDLMSTNGIHMTLPTGSDLWLTPGEPARVWPGTRVHFGSQSFVVEQASAPAAQAPATPAPPTPAPPTPIVPMASAARIGSPLISAVPAASDPAPAAPVEPLVPPVQAGPAPVAEPPISPANESPSFCVHCGAELLAGASFCVACGQALGGEADQPHAVPTGALDEELVIGNITIAAGQIMTPIGSAPLTGSMWSMNEQVAERSYIAQSTIIWAIVLSAFCGLGLLLLLKKEHEVTGTATIACTSGQLHYSTSLNITSQEQLEATRAQVAWVQAAAAG